MYFLNVGKLDNSTRSKYDSHQNGVTGEWHLDALISEHRARYTDPITKNKHQ